MYGSRSVSIIIIIASCRLAVSCKLKFQHIRQSLKCVQSAPENIHTPTRAVTNFLVTCSLSYFPHSQQICYFINEFYRQQAISPVSIKGRSIILGPNRCYGLWPLMTTLGTMKGIGNSGRLGWGGQRPRKFWRGGPFDNTDSSIDIAVQKSLLTYKVDLSMKNIVAWE